MAQGDAWAYSARHPTPPELGEPSILVRHTLHPYVNPLGHHIGFTVEILGIFKRLTLKSMVLHQFLELSKSSIYALSNSYAYLRSLILRRGIAGKRFSYEISLCP